MATEIFLKGALEPLLVDEPMIATCMNMSAAANANLRFFQGKDMAGNSVVIAIPEVTYMREVED